MKSKILIFGVGAAGRALYVKFIKDSNYEIVGFIENNDSMVGTKYNEVEIFSAKECLKLDFDKVAIGGIWADDMISQLKNIGLDDSKIMHVREKDVVFSTPSREIATDTTMKRLDWFLIKHNIHYFIHGSSLLNVLRKRSLSCASDVDLMVCEYKDIEFLATELPKYFNDLNVNVVLYKDDGILRKAGEIFKIIISNNDSEKINIDIVFAGVMGRCVVFDYGGVYLGKASFYIPLEYCKDTIRYAYKDFELNLPKQYDKYARLSYGENYIQIPEKFSVSDYGNLVDKMTLEKICFG